MQEPVYEIDDIKVTRITETVLTLPQQVLFPQANGLSTPHDTPMQLSIHTWLVQTRGLTILIDTGIGNFKPRPFSVLFDQLNNPFLERLAQAGITPEQIDWVLLTHLHTDHIGWNTFKHKDEWVPTFKNARYFAPQNDLTFFFKPEGASRRMLFEDSILPLIVNNQLQVIPAQGQALKDWLQFEATPGHCEGHMSIRLKTPRHDLLFCGDVMHNVLQVRLPEISSTFCANPELAYSTRRQMLDAAQNTSTIVFPAHFREQSAGKITQAKDGGYIWSALEPTHHITVESL